jgi:hypothetical protein
VARPQRQHYAVNTSTAVPQFSYSPLPSPGACHAGAPVVTEEAYNEAYAAALAQLNLEKAAVATIVRAWQRFSDQRIYRYYRDLIKFRERGDPQLMLKCINPGEAALVDAAAGIHVRFRLGGLQFPPIIYRLQNLCASIFSGHQRVRTAGLHKA